MRQGSESSDDSPEEFELEAEQGEEEDEDEDNAPAIIDSEEEAEIAAKEAQRELRNGLKNISFAENVEVAAEGEFRSVFQDVSFAAASRGMSLYQQIFTVSYFVLYCIESGYNTYINDHISRRTISTF